MSKMLLEQAYIDALTEIPNRRSFMTKAEMHQRFAADEPGHYIAMVDVDNFKRVNDQFGHDSGDVVLKRIAANIKASMHEFEYAPWRRGVRDLPGWGPSTPRPLRSASMRCGAGACAKTAASTR